MIRWPQSYFKFLRQLVAKGKGLAVRSIPQPWAINMEKLYHKFRATVKKIFVNELCFCGLEMEPGYIKFAQAEELAGVRKITRLIIKRLASSSQEELLAALRVVNKEVKGGSIQLTLVIPRHKVTVRLLSFPTVNEKELAGMVQLQSGRELPYPKEEIISDYLISERTKEGYTQVILVIVHRDVIQGYLDKLEKANLQPQRVTFSTEASLNWYRQASGEERSAETTLLVDPDSENTDLSIFYNMNLQFSRGLNFGLTHLQRQPRLKTKLVQEIKYTIEGYKRQGVKAEVKKIYLGRIGEITEEIRHFLEKNLDLPCQTFTPLRNLPCTREVFGTAYKEEVSLLRVLGVVLPGEGRSLNLLPLPLQERQKVKLRQERLRRIFILSLGVFFLCSAIFAKKIHDKNLYISYLDKEIARTVPLAAEVENKLKKIELIAARLRFAASSIDVLREVHTLVSPNIALSNLNYNEEKKIVVMQGVSTNRPEIYKFIATLEASPLFKNVQVKYVSEKKAREADYIDFKIECNLER